MKYETKKIALTAFFIALGTIIPQVFHLFGMGAGATFLPMHIPVLLAGAMLGGGYGLICGLITPILSSLATGMPPMVPVALSMCIELATYGLIIGILVKRTHILVAYVIAMLSGRVANGILSALILSLNQSVFSLSAYLSSVFISALPGILIQIILIPILYKTFKNRFD